MIQTNRSQLGRRKLVMVWLLAPLLLLLPGHAPPAIAASIEGEWKVRCFPSSDDCPNFTVSFDAQGGIVDQDVWGENSRKSGFGRITADQLEINIHNIFIFKGQIKSRGRFSAVALGLLDDHDADGDDVVTPAMVRRIGPLRQAHADRFNKNLRLLFKTIKRHIACKFRGDCDR